MLKPAFITQKTTAATPAVSRLVVAVLVTASKLVATPLRQKTKNLKNTR